MSWQRATKKDETNRASASETETETQFLQQDSHLDSTTLLLIIKHMEEQRHKDTAKREQGKIRK